MGYREDEESKKRAALLLKDREWFAERMAGLVEELKGVSEPARAGYLRGCLNAAMRAHARALGHSIYGESSQDEFES